MRTQYRELMGDLVDVRCDQIARVSVAPPTKIGSRGRVKGNGLQSVSSSS
jgi:hypothetical protein